MNEEDALVAAFEQWHPDLPPYGLILRHVKPDSVAVGQEAQFTEEYQHFDRIFASGTSGRRRQICGNRVSSSTVTPSSRSALLVEARSLRWFHSINFGDFTSPKRDPGGAAPNSTLRPIWALLEDTALSDSRCVDVGTADGIVAFTLERMGAAEVVATDGPIRRTFEVAHQLLGSRVRYTTNVPDTRLEDHFDHYSFDLVVMAGFIYHLLSPLSAIAQARRLLRPGGLIMIETVYIGGEGPTLHLNPAFDVAPVAQHTTYWLGTRECIENMLKLCCFEVIASASNSGIAEPGVAQRIGYLARAVRPSEVTGRPRQMVTMHERSPGTPNINYRMLDRGPAKASEATIRYAGPPGHRRLPSSWYPAWNELQPVPPQTVE